MQYLPFYGLHWWNKLKDNEHKHINSVKNKLRNYLYLVNVCHDLEGKVLKVETELQGIMPHSAPYVSGISDITPASRKVDLLGKVERYQFVLGAYFFSADRIRGFLGGLDHTAERM